MKRVLVTGASGFIGRTCLEPLIHDGYEVHAADLYLPKEKGSLLRWHEIDLLDEQRTAHLIASVRPTHLLHFAWYAYPGKYRSSMRNLHWVRASLNLFENFYTYGGERLVAAGSCAEYDWNYVSCSEYVTPLAPNTVYGSCKHALRIMLDALSRETGLSSAWGRIFFLYGPNEHTDRLVASVINALLDGRPALCSQGNQIRDFLHVADVGSAFVALLNSDVVGVVNIASGKPVSIRDLVLMIAQHIGQVELVQFGALSSRESEPPVLIADVGRLQNEVQWRPRYELQAGIIDTINKAQQTRLVLPQKKEAM